MKKFTDVKREERRRRMAVLRLELDYELATLYEAMVAENDEQKQRVIATLQQLREEMNELIAAEKQSTLVRPSK